MANRLETTLTGNAQQLLTTLAQVRADMLALGQTGQAGAQQAAQGLQELEKQAEQAGDQVEETAKEAEDLAEALEETGEKAEHAGQKLKETGSTAGGTKEALEKATSTAGMLGAGLTAIGAGAILATKSFLDAASQMQQFEATLTAITHSSQTAKAMLADMVKFAATTPFEVPSIVEAGVKIKSLGLDIQRFLPLAGDLAAVFGRDIPDAALALGKAASGSQDGIQVLADSFGITRQKMIEYGAAADNAGTISVKTSEEVKRLGDALEKIVKTEFGGAMAAQADTMKGAFSNLSDAVGRLSAALGAQLAPAATDAARGLTDLVQKVEAAPEILKSAAAWGTALTGGLGLLAGGALLTASAVGAAVTNINALVVAAGGAQHVMLLAKGLGLLAAAAAPLVLSLGAITYGTARVNQEFKDLEAAYKLVDVATKKAADSSLLAAKAHREWLGKSPEQLHAMGVQTREVVGAIEGLKDQIEFLRDRTDAWAVAKRKALEEQVRGLREVAHQLDGVADREKAEIERLKQIEEEAKKTAGARLQAMTDALEIEDARDGLTHEQKIARFKEMQTIAGLTADQRIALEKKVAAEEGAIRREAAAEAERLQKEEEARQKRAADEEIRLAEQTAKAKVKATEEALEQIARLNGDDTTLFELQLKKKLDALRKAQVEEKVIRDLEKAEREKHADDVAEKEIKKVEEVLEARRKATEEAIRLREKQKQAEEDALKAQEAAIDKVVEEDAQVRKLQAEYDALRGKQTESTGPGSSPFTKPNAPLQIGGLGGNEEDARRRLEDARERARRAAFAQRVNEEALKASGNDGWEPLPPEQPLFGRRTPGLLPGPHTQRASGGNAQMKVQIEVIDASPDTTLAQEVGFARKGKEEGFFFPH